jgi:hypothetical protein
MSVFVGCLATFGGLALFFLVFAFVGLAAHSATVGILAAAAVPLIAAAFVFAGRKFPPGGFPPEPPPADPELPTGAAAVEAAEPIAPEAAWRAARERFTGVQAEYAQLECDALEVLRLPAMTDVSVPSTARFVDAFAAAQALLTDRYPGPRIGDAFAEAADAAGRAWRAALDAAERIRLQGIDPAERAAVERVVKLLTTARDSDSEPERRLAHARARTELRRLDAAGVVHVPQAARTALDAATRGELPP